MTAMTDHEYLMHAIRNGSWERYEHPQRGETLTLQIGEFAVLSLHNILVDKDRPIDAFWATMKTPELAALLLAKVARLSYELDVAINAVVEAHDDL